MPRRNGNARSSYAHLVERNKCRIADFGTRLRHGERIADGAVQYRPSRGRLKLQAARWKNRPGTETHHCLFYKGEWEIGPIYHTLRDYFLVWIDAGNHDELHRSNQKYRVPVLSESCVRYTLAVLEIGPTRHARFPRRSIQFLANILQDYLRWAENESGEEDTRIIEEAIAALRAQAEFFAERGYSREDEGEPEAGSVLGEVYA